MSKNSKKEKVLEILKDDLLLNEMVLTQLKSFENLKRVDSKLKESTVNKKIIDIGMFFLHLQRLRENGDRIKTTNLTDLAYEYVRNGFFNSKYENLGTKQYRRNIYFNIAEGFNYIYRNYYLSKQFIIEPLSEAQIEDLNRVDNNNWFKKDSKRKTESGLEINLQESIMKKLGLKVYFDDNNKPYVLSHETAKILDKKPKSVLRDINNILSKFDKHKFVPIGESTDFSMFEDEYEFNKYMGDKEMGTEKRTTYRIYKDLILIYILGLNGDKYVKFKMEYVDAFNYIEEEFKKALEENVNLKKSFLALYDKVLIRNRDLILKNKNN